MRRRKVMELKNIKVQKAFEEFLEEHKAKNTSDNTLDREGNIYNRDDLYIISQALGHNRVDTSIAHYLK